MTHAVDLAVTARPDSVPTLAAARPDGETTYTPLELWKMTRLPRDLIYTAVQCGDLIAYNAGRGDRPRYFVRWADFVTWRESLRVVGK
ncbi:hypothetical protein ACXXCZ_00280 [Deinococcus sp. PEB2-67]